MTHTKSSAILVYLGANARSGFVKDLITRDENIVFISSALFQEEAPEMAMDKEFIRRRYLFDEDIHAPEGRIKIDCDCSNNDSLIIKQILDDSLIPLLWTRFSRKTRVNHDDAIRRFEIAYSLVKLSIRTLRQLCPATIIFAYEPHMLPMYIFKRTAIIMGFSCHTMVISPFVWRLFCLKENRSGITIKKSAFEDTATTNSESVQLLIDEKQGVYSSAKPFYEKRYETRGLLSLKILKRLHNNNWNFLRAITCKNSEKEYGNLTSPRNTFLNKKYICFFLHYQPEQSTLPEGGLFAHHIPALQMAYKLASTLGMDLVIREHPATFSSTFDARWRPEGFFRTIKMFGPGIHFDDLNLDPFTLIESSTAVSTITGSVLLEALIKGKPSIAFGRHPLWEYGHSALVDGFENDQDLQDKFILALRYKPDEITSATMEYLRRIYCSTFGPDTYKGNAAMNLDNLRDARNQALVQALSQ